MSSEIERHLVDIAVELGRIRRSIEIIAKKMS